MEDIQGWYVCVGEERVMSSNFKMCQGNIEQSHLHVVGFSDAVDLWVIKIKKPFKIKMILCARSTSSSSGNTTKRGAHSENMSV